MTMRFCKVDLGRWTALEVGRARFGSSVTVAVQRGVNDALG